MGIITQYESDITGVKDGFLDKVGTDPLDTDSQILSGAVNELNDEINDRVSEQYVAESINTEELSGIFTVLPAISVIVLASTEDGSIRTTYKSKSIATIFFIVSLRLFGYT